MSDFNLTAEQEAIVAMTDLDERHGGIVTIEAKAGAGKTSTLLAYANSHRNLNHIDMTTFSRSLALNLREKINEENLKGIVYAKTTHSLAWHWLHKICPVRKKFRMVKENNTFKIGDYNHGPGYAVLAEYFFGKLSSNSKNKAMGGRLREHHEAWHRSEFLTTEEYVAANGLTRKDEAFGIKDADALAKAIRAADDSVFYAKCPKGIYFDKLNLTHNAYMKFMQVFGYIMDDVSIFLHDEAQDSSECTRAWIQDVSKVIPVIAVGDPYQQINGWNGAHNILEDLSNEAVAKYVLTKSFRCGKGPTAVANAILGILGSSVLMEPRDEILYPKHPETAIISRTRAGVIETALECIKNDVPYCILCNLNSMLLNKLKNLEIWKNCGSTGHPRFLNDGYDIESLYQQYKYYPSANHYAKNHEVELSAMFRLVNIYSGNLGSKLDLILRNNQERDSNIPGMVCIGTVHAVKGMEFDNVILRDDFIKEDQRIESLVRPSADDIAMNLNSYVRKAWINNPNALCVIDSEEFRLKYTAATRAKFNLTMPDDFLPSEETIRKMMNLKAEGKLVFA